ncbi:MAG TPA: hypothetical protein VL625_07095 [Patescibacteria group bacterium]|nr:hypothetical protein [Patescibacteria group bacterium]
MTAQVIKDAAMLDKLWQAAETGDSATVRILAMKGVDLDACNENGQNAYTLAQINNHPATAKAIQAGREFQYLKRVGIEISRVGNLHSPTGGRIHFA